jgi:hypothetical protein
MNKNIRKIIVYYTDGTYSEIQSASVSEIKPVINPSITKCQVCGFPGGHGGLPCPTLNAASWTIASNGAASWTITSNGAGGVVPSPDELKQQYLELKK